MAEEESFPISPLKAEAFRILVKQTLENFYSEARFRIEKINKLELDTEYEHYDPKTGWLIRVTKRAGHIFVSIMSRDPLGETVRCVVIQGIRPPPREFFMTRGEGISEYVANLSVGDGQWEDVLELHFQYDLRNNVLRSRPRICSTTQHSEACATAFHQDMLKARADDAFRNFTFKLEGGLSEMADRAILEARTRIMDKNPRHWYQNEMSLDVGRSKKVFDPLLEYLYSGELPASRRMLVHVYRLASRLGMESLTLMAAKRLLTVYHAPPENVVEGQPS